MLTYFSFTDEDKLTEEEEILIITKRRNLTVVLGDEADIKSQSNEISNKRDLGALQARRKSSVHETLAKGITRVEDFESAAAFFVANAPSLIDDLGEAPNAAMLEKRNSV